MKYIDADKLIAILERQNVDKKVIEPLIRIIDSLQQEQSELPKIARIRQEIERRYKEFDGKTGDIATASRLAYLDVISFLDTLSEEPSKSLQEEIETWIPAHISIRTDETLPINPTELADICKEWGKCIARHFAEWQASQMPMPEDTVLFNKGVAEGRRLEREDMLKDAEECELYWDGDFLAIDLNMVALGYSEKDKVKVIVLKAEEE